MASAIQTVGMIAFVVFLLAILVLATMSKVNERKRGRRKDDGGDSDFPTDANRWAGDSDVTTD